MPVTTADKQRFVLKEGVLGQGRQPNEWSACYASGTDLIPSTHTKSQLGQCTRAALWLVSLA